MNQRDIRGWRKAQRLFMRQSTSLGAAPVMPITHKRNARYWPSTVTPNGHSHDNTCAALQYGSVLGKTKKKTWIGQKTTTKDGEVRARARVFGDMKPPTFRKRPR